MSRNRPDLHTLFERRSNQGKEWLIINIQVFDVCRSNPHRLFGFTYQGQDFLLVVPAGASDPLGRALVCYVLDETHFFVIFAK